MERFRNTGLTHHASFSTSSFLPLLRLRSLAAYDWRDRIIVMACEIENGKIEEKEKSGNVVHDYETGGEVGEKLRGIRIYSP